VSGRGYTRQKRSECSVGSYLSSEVATGNPAGLEASHLTTRRRSTIAAKNDLNIYNWQAMLKIMMSKFIHNNNLKHKYYSITYFLLCIHGIDIISVII